MPRAIHHALREVSTAARPRRGALLACRGGLAALLLLALHAANALAADSDRPRAYVGLRIGESNPITKANDVASVSVGANLDRYFGIEFSLDGYELFLDTARQGRVAELGVLGLVPQVRLRYPLLENRLVPYFLGGAGLAIAQINDASVPTEWTSGGLTDVRALGAVGGGVEYYVSDDIALGVEGKYLITGSKSYDAGGTKGDVDMSVGVLTFGLRAFYPELDPDPLAFAASRAARRFYLNVRFGGALPMAGRVFPGVGTDPEQSLFGTDFGVLYAVSFGTQIGEVLDLELSASNYELHLDAPGAGGNAEYAVFPLLAQMKLHLPLADRRVDPYALLGVGAENVEVNDAGSTDVVLDGNDLTVIGALGVGVDYFLTRDVAFGMEAKYVFSRGHTLQIDGGEPLRGDLDSLLVSLGIRAYLFDF
jgi:opacity protein-like surface antigen